MANFSFTRAIGKPLGRWIELRPVFFGFSAACVLALLFSADMFALKFERRIGTVERTTVHMGDTGVSYTVTVLLDGKRVSAELLAPTTCKAGDKIEVVKQTNLFGVRYTTSTADCRL